MEKTLQENVHLPLDCSVDNPKYITMNPAINTKWFIVPAESKRWAGCSQKFGNKQRFCAICSAFGKYKSMSPSCHSERNTYHEPYLRKCSNKSKQRWHQPYWLHISYLMWTLFQLRSERFSAQFSSIVEALIAKDMFGFADRKSFHCIPYRWQL